MQKARPSPVTTTTAIVVVPRRVLEGAPELAQRLEVEGVQDLRPVDAPSRPRRRLHVEDRLEAELRIDRARVRRHRHYGLPATRARGAALTTDTRITVDSFGSAEL